MRRFVGLAACGVALYCISPAFAADKNGKPNKQEQKDNERVRDAQKKLDDARDRLRDEQRDFNAAEKQFQRAEADEKATLRALEAARNRAEERISKVEGLPKLQADLKDAQQVFDKAKAPLIEALRATAAFQAAAKEADDAMARLKSLRGTGNANDAARRQLVGELNRTALRPGQLEAVAVENDAAASRSHEQLAALQGTVNERAQKVRRLVDSDDDVKAAQRKLDEARTAAKSDRENLVRRRREVALAEQNVAQKAGQLQQARAADRKNDGKPKNNGK